MRCEHCQLDFREDALLSADIGGTTHFFCCHGCEQVYRLLHEQGLGDFYTKLRDTTLDPIAQPHDNAFERFSSEGFAKKYIKPKNGMHEICLIIDKIHCVACVWLNETILRRADGIVQANLNYTTHKATIVFDQARISPAEILRLIRQIGYDAHPYDPMIAERQIHKTQREFYRRMIVAIFCTMNIMWIAVAQYAGYFSGITDEMRLVLNVASFCLCVPTLFYSGWIFWRGAYFGLKNGILSMDSLLVSGSGIAFVYSIWASFAGKETYFESITMIIAFVLVGRFLEQRGRKIAVDSLDSLNAAIPLQITTIRDNARVLITPEEARIGEVIEVLAGEKIALDGVLLSDYALCDESMLSGESVPVAKTKNDKIYSGAIVLQAPLRYVVTHDVAHSFLSTILALVQESLNHKPKIEEQANKISRYFSATILSLALLTFVFWIASGAAIALSVSIAVSVIIIACPCALALATPMACIVGLGNALRKKILFKKSRFLETLAHVDMVVFDKTGTLTQQELHVTHASGIENLDTTQLSMLQSLVAQSTHPVARAVESFARQYGTHAISSLQNFEQKNARGIVASAAGRTFIGGNLLLLDSYHVAYPDALREESSMLFCFAELDTSGENNDGGALLAVFFVQDTLKKDAQECVQKLQAMGLDVCIASGDRQAPVARVANALGIAHFYANQTPDSKAQLIESLRAQGKTILMVGDGINDTIAFAKSNAAIAMGSGVDVAISVSDVVVLDNTLQSICDALTISRACLRAIRQNLAISIVYNALTIPLAMAGFVIPLIAAASMSLSSLLVVGNSLRNKT